MFKSVIAGTMIIFMALALPALAHKFEKNGITVAHPWVRATPGGSTLSAGYVKVTNTGTADDKLISGSLENAAAVEFHETKDEGGVMKMRALTEGVTIKPGETVTFAPGGNHMMFMGLSKPIAAGTAYKGTLTFEKAGSIDIEYKAEPVGALESADH
jgi:periplasmic copper chaperone A